jgi:hypothetical protein
VDLEKAHLRQAAASADVERAQQRLAALRREIEAWVQDNPYCSACGQAVTAELILSGGHAHE